MAFSSDKVLPMVLQKAEVNVLSQSDCKRAYGPVSPRMLCAGVPSGERDACRVSTNEAGRLSQISEPCVKISLKVSISQTHKTSILTLLC